MAILQRTTSLKRPNASFMLNAQEFYCSTMSLSATEIGRLFTDICDAVDNRDEAFLARHRRYIGRIYWRENQQRLTLPDSTRRAVLDRDGCACVLCGSDYKIELDHIVPYSKGGQHTVDNLRVLCKPCNRRKGASMPGVTA